MDGIEHGTMRGWWQHHQRHDPIPEDDSCGCRAARNIYQCELRRSQGLHKARCRDCRHYRGVRADRDDRCPSCWKRHLMTLVFGHESAAVLTNGRWLPVEGTGGVQRWVPNEESA